MRELAAFRAGCDAFREGRLRILQAEGGLLIFERYTDRCRAGVVINRSQAPIQLTIGGRQITVPEYGYQLVEGGIDEKK